MKSVSESSLPHELVIKAHQGWVSLQLAEVLKYHELIFFLAWRDISIRYKQTALGAAWAIIQPLSMMLVFSVIFGHLAKIPSDGSPYPVFSYTSMLPWQYFATAMTSASNSLLGNASLLTKVYFPRLVIPIASVLPAAIDFFIAFSLVIVLALYYHVALTWHLLLLPLFLLLALITALGVGLWLSALSIEYRDIRYVVPFLTQLWLFASPVAYPTSLIPEQYRALYSLNPMVGVIEGFRWAVLGQSGVSGLTVCASAIVAIVLLVTGVFYFRSLERTFADMV